MYEPKLPSTGISFFLLGISAFYNAAIFILLVLTLSIILFRFIRLLIKDGTIKKILTILLFPLLFIFSVIYYGRIEASNKINESQITLNKYEYLITKNANKVSGKIITLKDESNYSPKSGDILGTLNIDKISLKIPIIEDANDKNLWLGAAHIKGTPLPNEKGNSFLASHNAKIYGKLFNRLHEINIGDKVLISTPNENFNYVVYDKVVVPYDDTECFKKIKGEYNISLVTCTNSGRKRLIIYCERIFDNK